MSVLLMFCGGLGQTGMSVLLTIHAAFFFLWLEILLLLLRLIDRRLDSNFVAKHFEIIRDIPQEKENSAFFAIRQPFLQRRLAFPGRTT
jgi:hypothetical protein